MAAAAPLQDGQVSSHPLAGLESLINRPSDMVYVCVTVTRHHGSDNGPPVPAGNQDNALALIGPTPTRSAPPPAYDTYNGTYLNVMLMPCPQPRFAH